MYKAVEASSASRRSFNNLASEPYICKTFWGKSYFLPGLVHPPIPCHEHEKHSSQHLQWVFHPLQTLGVFDQHLFTANLFSYAYKSFTNKEREPANMRVMRQSQAELALPKGNRGQKSSHSIRSSSLSFPTPLVEKKPFGKSSENGRGPLQSLPKPLK